jgi:capsid portal protein
MSLRTWSDLRQEKQDRVQAGLIYQADPRGIIEPPYNLETLVNLLAENPDYYRVVDQFATDVAGRGWDLVDAEDPMGGAELLPGGDVERAAARDAATMAQRIEAKKRLEALGRDFNGLPVPIRELAKAAIADYQAIGDGYFEVHRDPTKASAKNPALGQISSLFHLPGMLTRKTIYGGYVQLDESGREVAFFRPFGSQPTGGTALMDATEARISGVEPGAVKDEVKNFRRYNAAELFYGVPPIISALAHVYGNIFSETRNVRYFYNRAMPDWLVEIKANRATFNDDGSNAILDQYETAILEHMHFILQGDDQRTLVLRIPTGEIETKWEKLDTGLADSDFLLGYRTANRDVIIGVYRMPPHRIGIVETASLGTGSGESQEETYKHSQLDPQQEMLEEFFNAILDDWGFQAVRFKFNEIDVIDELREWQMFAIAAATGAASINELRTWMSEIRKDQDFEDVDEDVANIPMWIVEQQSAQMLGGTFPGPTGGLPAETPVRGEGSARPVLEGEEEEEAATQRPPLPTQAGAPVSMALAVDPAYARIRREMAERFRSQVAERRRTLQLAARGKPVVVSGNGDES